MGNDMTVYVYTKGAQTRMTADKAYGDELVSLGFTRRRHLAPKDAQMFCEGWEAAWKDGVDDPYQ